MNANTKEAKAKYNKKCKSRIVTFYIHEKELFEFSKKINFQAFVKECLKCEMAHEKMKENGEVAVCISDFDDLYEGGF